MPRRKTAKRLRAIFEKAPAPRDADLRIPVRPDEAARFRLASRADRADSLAAWIRKLAHDRCDAIDIPRG